MLQYKDQLNFRKYNKLSHTRLENILHKFAGLSIAVIGDGCLDVYWEADMVLSELSRETPHFPLPVTKERLSLGAGGNVASNLVSLGIKDVKLLTIIGDDWRGNEFLKLIQNEGISVDYIIKSMDRITPAYCKPIRHGLSELSYEDPRIDFENRTQIKLDLEKKVIQYIQKAFMAVDIIAVVDQLKNGVITDKIRSSINEMAVNREVVVDSRNNIDKYRNVILKPNELEAIQAVYSDKNITKVKQEERIEVIQRLIQKTKCPVLMTLGKEGSLWYNDYDLIEIPTKAVTGELDIVGAGDAFMASFIASRSAGAEVEESAFIANLAAAITIKKIKTTGNVTREEIIKRYEMISGVRK